MNWSKLLATIATLALVACSPKEPLLNIGSDAEPSGVPSGVWLRAGSPPIDPWDLIDGPAGITSGDGRAWPAGVFQHSGPFVEVGAPFRVRRVVGATTSISLDLVTVLLRARRAGEHWDLSADDFDGAPEVARTPLTITAFTETPVDVQLRVDGSAMGGPFSVLTILALPGQRPSVRSDAPREVTGAWGLFARGGKVQFGDSLMGCERRAQFTLKNVSPRTIAIGPRPFDSAEFQILTDFPATLGPSEVFTGEVRYFPPMVGNHVGHLLVDVDLDPEPAYIRFEGFGITRTATTPCP